MEDSRKELFMNFEQYLIGLDDMFTFKCRECGQCCRNRDDILLTARDIYNIAVKLELTVIEVIDTYCETYIGYESRMPIVRLKPQGVNKVCPLLKGNRCAVHDKKPVVCALFPLGRVVSGENINEGILPGKSIKLSYGLYSMCRKKSGI